MGECNEAQTFALIGAFYDEYLADCASVNVYQYEESETWIGEWLKKGGNRDQLVYIVYHLLLLQLQVPTKYKTRNYRDNQSNLGRNLLKSMHVSVEKRLKTLQTDYIDILKVLWWDSTTSVEEAMHGLDSLITSGKVLYLDISDILSVGGSQGKRLRARKCPAPVLGVPRELECRGSRYGKGRDHGMEIAPRGPPGGGKLKTTESRVAAQGGSRGEDSGCIEKDRGENGGEVACCCKYKYIPILSEYGPVNFKTSSEELVEVDSTEDSDVKFPMDFIFEKYKISTTASDVFLAPEDC
ncbi:hypothetical protein AnigIFM60653_009004 [Aspergillus niger]|nr:hypothetical protein AnigIFM60653_009004 [Aspergillus niger]